MPVEIPVFDRVLDKLHGFDSKAVAALTGLEKPHVREIMFPRFWGVLEIQRQRLIAQAAEVLLVAADTTEFESLIHQKGYEQPHAIVWLTAGFKPPEDAEKIGQYGKGAFKNFLQPDIEGHHGDVFISRINGKSVIWFQGRPHPNEWEGERWADMQLAHQYNVVKEYVRRRRTKGENPLIVTTYLAGAIRGSEFGEGDLAIIGSDMELNAVLGAGKGPRSILDQMFGIHFQSKIYRSCTPELAQLAFETAKEQGIEDQVGISAVIGTPEPTEFQDMTEIALGELLLKEMRSSGKFTTLVHTILKSLNGIKTGASYDMGINYELALFRQLFPNEAEINRVGFVLHSDEVGMGKSTETSHTGNVDVAGKTMPRNMKYLTGLLEKALQTPLVEIADTTDHSVIAKLADLPKERKSELVNWLVNRF